MEVLPVQVLKLSIDLHHILKSLNSVVATVKLLFLQLNVIHVVTKLKNQKLKKIHMRLRLKEWQIPYGKASQKWKLEKSAETTLQELNQSWKKLTRQKIKEKIKKLKKILRRALWTKHKNSKTKPIKSKKNLTKKKKLAKFKKKWQKN